MNSENQKIKEILSNPKLSNNMKIKKLLLFSNLPLNSIAQLFGYRNTDLCLIVLELARELTLANNKDLAGILEKKVEQSKPKSPLVKEKQRDYYSNRPIYRNQCKNNCNQ